MATKKDEVEVLSPEVEEVIDAEIETSLVKQNVTEALLSKLESEYKDLKIKGPDDKEGYLVVQSARKDCKSVRVLIGKICKHGRAKANAEAKKWVNKENELTERVSTVEERLEADEKAWEEERDRRKQLEAARIEQQGIIRMKDMLKFGAEIQGSNWVLGDVVFECALVKEADDDIYVTIYEAFKAVFDEKEKVRLDKEEADRKERQLFQQQQDDMKRQQQEMKDMRTEGRISLLESLGLTKEGTDYVYGRVRVALGNIEERDNERWNEAIVDIKAVIADIKQKEAEKKEKQELFKLRLSKLRGFTYNGFTVSYPIDLDGGQGIYGSMEDIIRLSEEEFQDTLTANDRSLAEMADKKEQKRLQDLEDARLEGIGKSRRQALSSLGISADPADLDLGRLSEDKWNYMYGDFKTAYDIKQQDLANEKERLRLEELGEKQRYDEVVKYLKAVRLPELKNGQLRAKVNVIKSFIDGLK